MGLILLSNFFNIAFDFCSNAFCFLIKEYKYIFSLKAISNDVAFLLE